jgi:hypothetical protein
MGVNANSEFSKEIEIREGVEVLQKGTHLKSNRLKHCQYKEI